MARAGEAGSGEAGSGLWGGGSAVIALMGAGPRSPRRNGRSRELSRVRPREKTSVRELDWVPPGEKTSLRELDWRRGAGAKGGGMRVYCVTARRGSGGKRVLRVAAGCAGGGERVLRVTERRGSGGKRVFGVTASRGSVGKRVSRAAAGCAGGGGLVLRTARGRGSCGELVLRRELSARTGRPVDREEGVVRESAVSAVRGGAREFGVDGCGERGGVRAARGDERSRRAPLPHQRHERGGDGAGPRPSGRRWRRAAGRGRRSGAGRGWLGAATGGCTASKRKRGPGRHRGRVRIRGRGLSSGQRDGRASRQSGLGRRTTATSRPAIEGGDR